MNHEPECQGPYAADDCVDCAVARAAYQRGREDAAKALEPYLVRMTAELKAVRGYHSPHLMGEAIVCAGCSDAALDEWVLYPCETIYVMDSTRGDGEQA